jgi:transposase-like protein
MMTCKFCSSQNLVKYGKRGEVQYYLCRACGHTFSGNNALPGMRFAPEHIAASIHMYYDGLSIDALRKQLRNKYNIYPSDSTVHKWIVHFTEVAANLAKDLNVHVGDFWIVGETALKIYNDKYIWLWDIMDDETRFLLASRIPVGRTMRNSRQLMSRAVKSAGHTPKIINLDKEKAFLDGIEIVFGAETSDLQPAEFAFKPSNNRIERFHAILEDRSTILRRMKNRETAKLVMEGWLVHYNYFRPQTELNDKTPGEVAKATFPYHNWQELITGTSLIDN